MKQDHKDYGSQYRLRMAVNDARELMTRELRAVAGIPSDEDVEWVSPLPPKYTEYQDRLFIEKLRITLPKVPLEDFWPKGGPVWDALARTPKKRVFLVEAKGHIPEMNSPESGASPKSLRRIAKSLNQTKMFLDADPLVDWTRTFFQYTNRVAHLYLLRELNEIDAYLVNVYFINETRMKGPSSIQEWNGALTLLKTYLGITRTKLSPFMKDVFIDVNELKRMSSNRVEATTLPTRQS